jgi:acetolactate synthase I/II/III large subunit
MKNKVNLKKVSDIVAEFLIEEGITHVFAISGGASLHLIHSLADNENIQYICNHNEQASAMAADGYSRVSGKTGVAITTSGPGATNLITGICCSYYDSIPSLFITGQVSTMRMKGDTGVRQIGFQETPIVEIAEEITKYAYTIVDPEEIKYQLQKALHIAKSGRPGPVLIDIPDDLQRQLVDPLKLKNFQAPAAQELPHLKNSLQDTIDSIMNSKRPILIAGWGVHLSNTEAEFLKFAESFNIPIALTWGAADLIPFDHDLYVGTFGTHGNRHANFAVQNADLIISLGSRLDTKSTGSPINTFAREARKIMIDIDINELNKFQYFDLKFDQLIHCDLKDFFNNFSKLEPTKDTSNNLEWLKQINKWKHQFISFDDTKGIATTQVNPYNFVDSISNNLKGNEQIFIDTGCSIAWFMQSLRVKDKVRVFHDFNNTAMGWALPAAIGGYYANLKHQSPIIAIVGDGSFMMTSYELATVMHHNIPIKIFIMNNQGYSMIQQTQDQWMDSNYHASSKEGGLSFPNYEKLASTYNIKYFELNSGKDFSLIDEIMNDGNPLICNVCIDKDFRVSPQVKFGKPNEDMGPLLPRDMFKESMIIEPIS